MTLSIEADELAVLAILLEPHGLMRVSAVLNLGAQQLAREQDFTIQLERLIHKADTRTALQVALEIDVPGKGLDRLRGDGIRNAGQVGGRIER